jgi:hypothetical protein
VYTIIETPIFEKYAAAVWSDDEREAFKLWIAQNPIAGDVIPQSGGLRKVRWCADGKGKRGGTRVLLIVYTKAKFDNLPLNFLKQLKEAAENGQ